MRHSSLDLTTLARRSENVHTHPPSPPHARLRRARPSLLDVAGELDVVPEMSLGGAVESPLTMHGRPAESLAMRAQEA